MLLSDRQIAMRCNLKKDPLVVPFHVEQLQPASYDVTLGEGFKQISSWLKSKDPIDPLDLEDGHTIWIDAARPVLQPGEFLLGRTVEEVNLPGHMAGRLEGKSSLARLGLLVHSTAGFIDPGFRGTITLEFFNAGPRPIVLTSGMRIGQVCFMLMNGSATHPYGHEVNDNHYQGQAATTESRYGR